MLRKFYVCASVDMLLNNSTICTVQQQEWIGLDCSISVQRQGAGSCEHDTEVSGSISCGVFLDWLQNCWQKKAPWICGVVTLLFSTVNWNVQIHKNRTAVHRHYITHLWSEQNRTESQAVIRPALNRRAPGSNRGKSVWNLRWTIWRWDRFVSQ